MNSLRNTFILALALLVPEASFAIELTIVFPHPAFQEKTAISLTNLSTRQRISLWSAQAATKPDQLRVPHSFELPENLSGEYLVELFEGSFSSSGWYQKILLPTNEPRIEITLPSCFASILVRFDQPCQKLPGYDNAKDYCIRLYRLDVKKGFDPYFLAGAALDTSSLESEITIGFVNEGNYLVQVVSTDGLTVLYQFYQTINSDNVVRYQKNQTPRSIVREQQIEVTLKAQDAWNGWVSPMFLRNVN